LTAKSVDFNKKQQVFDNFNFLQQSLEFDPNSSQINAANTDWLIFRGKMLREFLTELNSILGQTAKNVIEEAAYPIGANFAQELLDRGLETQEVPTIIELLLNQAGWGKSVTQVDKETKTVTIRIENCVTARESKTAQPNCYFLKGYFRGVYEKVYGAKYHGIEKLCMAKGDNACVFQLSLTEES
jgi:predicted hydrocarbon binding protein